MVQIFCFSILLTDELGFFKLRREEDIDIEIHARNSFVILDYIFLNNLDGHLCIMWTSHKE